MEQVKIFVAKYLGFSTKSPDRKIEEHRPFHTLWLITEFTILSQKPEAIFIWHREIERSVTENDNVWYAWLRCENHFGSGAISMKKFWFRFFKFIARVNH